MTFIRDRATVLLLGAVLLWGVGAFPGRAASGPVAGKITNSVSGAPLANVIVEILETHDSTQTDGTGHYAFPNVINGSYTMLIGKSTYQPITRGNVTFGSCCIGTAGNVDCDPTNAIDISDLSTLIDNLYISMAPLCCPATANIDGQPGIDISDLSRLIDFLYINFTPPAPCQ